MVVLVIIGVLAALIVPNVLERADDARVTAARTDVNNLMQALKLYRLDNQRYPTTEQGLQALVTRPAMAPVPHSSQSMVLRHVLIVWAAKCRVRCFCNHCSRAWRAWGLSPMAPPP